MTEMNAPGNPAPVGRQLEGKVAAVTGASRGIGRAIAELFAMHGAKVVVHGRDEAALTAVVDACRAHGGEAISFIGDVRNADAMGDLVKLAVDTFGALDIGIANAGITKDQLFLRMSDAEFDEVIDINLKGAFHFAKACTRQMRKQKHGRLIFMSSLAGVVGNPGQANYSASKGAINAMTRALAKELIGYGVLVNAIAPGVIETDLTANYSPEIREAGIAKMPMKRFGEPMEVANAALFLAGPMSTYITGQILHVAGGVDLGG